MRIRLQLLLPFVMAAVVAAGLLLLATVVADAVRDALVTVPGITRERAIESALAALWLAGIVVVGAAVGVAVLVARFTVAPLARLRAAAEHDRSPQPAVAATGIAEIEDLARSLGVSHGRLRDQAEAYRRERTALAEVVEATSEGIVRVDGNGRVARVNGAARALLALPDDVVGTRVAGTFRSPEIRRLIEEALSEARGHAAEVVLDERRILATASPQEGGGVVATFVDLTDLRRLEEVRRDFVANASHELKTPLTSIRGYAETLRAGGLPEPEQREFLDTIARNADRLQRIVDDLLDLSRLESGRWEPILEAVRVLHLAERSWEPFADRAAERNVTVDIGGDETSEALADRRALEHVFTNLFDNAIRHTSAGGTVCIRTGPSGPPPGVAAAEGEREEEEEGEGSRGWLVVEVADTGTGIPRDALPRIFERFYRVDPARSRAEGGTGLGLSIVRHLVQSMGGAVTAESILGKGTTFRFWLPQSS